MREQEDYEPIWRIFVCLLAMRQERLEPQSTWPRELVELWGRRAFRRMLLHPVSDGIP